MEAPRLHQPIIEAIALAAGSFGGLGQSEELDAAVRYALHKGKLIFSAADDGAGPPAALLRSAHPGWANHQVTTPAAESYAPLIALPAPRRPGPPGRLPAPRPRSGRGDSHLTRLIGLGSTQPGPASAPHVQNQTDTSRRLPQAFPRPSPGRPQAVPGPSPGWEPACSSPEP
ncbi:hypothetical protein AB0C90_05440 [Streptomyces sp. NPDC048550]|uniref:hypothetical protein n=1 Tax=Streptomyces sp. NPDC048550 TaxID=3155739 RepID=UPI003418E006